MQPYTMALFGAAERGEFHSLLAIHSLAELEEKLGQPPAGSRGIDFAIQALMYNRRVFFFRVEDEGFSKNDYYEGFKLLFALKEHLGNMSALCLPGVGDPNIIEATDPILSLYRGSLITTEQDLYDYLTN
ncbi:MAG: hypothetical protein WDZ28_05025 [Simkaniaceae bacterium]